MARNKSGNTVLHLACNSTGSMTRILNACGSPEVARQLVSARNSAGAVALHAYASKRHLSQDDSASVAALLQAGSPLLLGIANPKNVALPSDREPPVHPLCSRHGHSQVYGFSGSRVMRVGDVLLKDVWTEVKASPVKWSAVGELVWSLVWHCMVS